jgi:hypothetical protein
MRSLIIKSKRMDGAYTLEIWGWLPRSYNSKLKSLLKPIFSNTGFYITMGVQWKEILYNNLYKS